MGVMQFELYSRFGFFGRKHYFRIRAANGQIVMQSEGYSRKIDARETIDSIKRRADTAETIEVES